MTVYFCIKKCSIIDEESESMERGKPIKTKKIKTKKKPKEPKIGKSKACLLL